VTSNHVVGTSDKVTVVLQDNSRHQAKLVGRDEKTDIALIKIDAPQNLPYVSWGDSDQSKVGDWVVAVGNPFGLGGSVTAGIISAIGRNINEGPYDDFIQIDAPINRGNSGGPTFNLRGQVIGINTAIYSPSGGSVGIGFAIPASVAKPIVAELREKGHVTRGWLGVAVQSITPSIAKGLGLPSDTPAGALVAAVTPNGPAAKAGINPGDIIVSVDGQQIKSVSDLPRRIAGTAVGRTVNVSIRRSGQDKTVRADIGELKEKEQAASTPPTVRENEDAKVGSLGLELSQLDNATRRQFRIPREVEGVAITQVSESSPFADAGIEAGDVIVSIDQEPVKTADQAAALLKKAADRGNVLVLLNRRGSSQFVGLAIGAGAGMRR
jgi:serine protease Do